MTEPSIVIAGAGSVGGFVGGMLARAGRQVTFLGRERFAAAAREKGLRLTDGDGLDHHLGAKQVAATTDPACLAEASVILVTVKGHGTAEMAQLISAHASPNAVIVSLQNGVTNKDRLVERANGRPVLAGMVPFNVLQMEGHRFHRGSSGAIMIEAPDHGVSEMFDGSGLGVTTDRDMMAVLWGKLTINLNNALNALAGIPLREELLTPAWRSLLADQQAEALAVLRAEGIAPRKATPLPPHWLPFLLRLPTPVFRLAAAASLKIDPLARSSMWEDLERRRPTEVDDLQGAVVKLAAKHSLSVPVCTGVRQAIRDAEARGNGSPGLSPDDVRELCHNLSKK